MKKAYSKTVARMFGKHITRFLSIIFMVVIAVGFISGIGSSADMIELSLAKEYRTRNTSDIILKSKKDEGFSDEDIQKARALYGADNVNAGMSLDAEIEIGGEKLLTRLYFLDFDNWTVNVPEIVSGKAAANGTDIYVEQGDNKLQSLSVGDSVELDFADILKQLSGTDLPSAAALKKTVNVSAVVGSPLTFGKDGEPSYKNPENAVIPDNMVDVNNLITLECILYLPKSVIPTMRDIMPFLDATPLLPDGDMYIAYPDRAMFAPFGSRYKKYTDEQVAYLTAELGSEMRALTLYDNYSVNSMHSYAGRVKNIGLVLMVAFMFVTALVVLSNMTRLMEEERGQIACLKTLGYSPAKIVAKYVLFAALATGIGGLGAYFVGWGLGYFIYIIFNYAYAMPPLAAGVQFFFFLVVFAVIALATVAATLIAGAKLCNEVPAELLRPKPPRAGKKVFIERIPLIWNRLSFKYKSTVRNVLRFKSRFFMTVISVAISTALILAGLALLDVCIFGTLKSPSITGIALVVILFAGLLTAVAIYTITNINISERNRELATLMVLGYFDGEVSSYIYREIFIDAIIGIIFGYPCSLLIMLFLFDVLGMGSIAGVTWFWWLIAPFVVLLFTGLVCLMLRHKIVGIDMNESLKAIE